jgi:hypothetical protein
MCRHGSSPFILEQVIARQHGGTTVQSNLAGPATAATTARVRISPVLIPRRRRLWRSPKIAQKLPTAICAIRKWGMPRADNFDFETRAPLSTEQQAFHLEEYKQIRSELILLLTRVETLFRYAFLVTAAVYAWIIAQSFGLVGLSVDAACVKLPRALIIFGWCIPPAFAVFAGTMWVTEHAYIACSQRGGQ